MAENSTISIDSFVDNSFYHTGFLRPDKFEFKINMPNLRVFGSEQNNIVAEYLQENIKTFEIPGITVGESATPLRHSINNRSVGAITATFYESRDMKVRNAIWKWIDSTVRSQADDDNFLRNYLDDIKASINIFMINNNGVRLGLFHEFKDVFPTNVNGMTFDTTNDTSIGETTITFKYRFHVIKE